MLLVGIPLLFWSPLEYNMAIFTNANLMYVRRNQGFHLKQTRRRRKTNKTYIHCNIKYIEYVEHFCYQPYYFDKNNTTLFSYGNKALVLLILGGSF